MPGERYRVSRAGALYVHGEGEKLVLFLASDEWQTVERIEANALPGVTFTLWPGLAPGAESEYLRGMPLDRLKQLVCRALEDDLTDKATLAAGHSRHFVEPFIVEAARVNGRTTS